MAAYDYLQEEVPEAEDWPYDDGTDEEIKQAWYNVFNSDQVD